MRGVLADMIGALCAELGAQTAAGQPVRAVWDPRDAHPPCALVLPDRITPRTKGIVRADVRILLIAPGPGNGDALAWLDEALPAVWAAAGRQAPASLVMWESPHTGVPLLAYSVDLTRDIPCTIEEGETP